MLALRSSVVAIAAVACAAIAQGASAQIVFYEQEGLRGRSFAANRPVDNLDHFGFNDRASSAIVENGEWQVCEDAGFRGRCLTLRRGQYPSLGAMGMNNRISSTRPVRGGPEYGYAPRPPAPAPYPYPYYPHYGERLFPADVVAVRAVVGPGAQQCWVERQQVAAEGGPNVPGAIVGGVIGGVLGHQIGNGRGNDVATALGAIGGAAIGANVNRPSVQSVQRCATVPVSARPQYWDVTYTFRGVYHRVQLAAPPGPTITVNARGEPRL
jgi:uncharacterized protein YcfJ